MATAREHLAADLALCLADTSEAAVPFTWDGDPFTGVINREPMGGLDHYDSVATETARLLVAAAGFPRPFPGGVHQFDTDRWLVVSVGDLPGTLVIELARYAA